jgi:hypothetical protein
MTKTQNHIRRLGCILLAVLLIASALVTLTSCSGIAKDRMIRYLENKYGLAAEDIVVTSFRPVQIVQGYHEMFAYIKGTDKYQDDFGVKMTADWKKIEDNYYGLLIREELEQMAKDVFADVSSGIQVKSVVNFNGYFSPEVNADTPLVDILGNDWLAHNQVLIFVREGNIVQGTDFKETAERFKTEWKKIDPKTYNSQRIMLIPASVYDRIDRYNYRGLVFDSEAIAWLQDE